jgi:signal transduction histidine kinase
MDAMINSLLEYVKIGRQNIELETIDIAKLLAEIIDSLDPPRSLKIEIELGMPTLIGKRLLLSQVLSNLIGNAIKHHHLPDGKIEISASKHPQKYQFAIADNGPGIAPEHHDKIFVIFQTLQDSQNSEHTGIGLSIVKKIVEAEGCEIWLESIVGKGTVFFFTWPLA